DPPGENHDRGLPDAPEHQLPGVPDDSAAHGEVRDAPVGHRDPVRQPLRESAQSRPEDQSDPRRRSRLLPDEVRGRVEAADKTRVAHFTTPSSQISPAMAAVMKDTRDPASSARNPSRARSDLRVGARPPMPPIWMPIEEKFAKPQRAKVAINFPFSESCPTTSFIIEKAKNSLITVLFAIRLPTMAASSFGAPSRIARGPRTQPKTVCRENAGLPQKEPTQ